MHEKDCISLKNHTESHTYFHSECHFRHVPVDQRVQLLYFPTLFTEHSDPVHRDQPAAVVGIHGLQYQRCLSSGSLLSDGFLDCQLY